MTRSNFFLVAVVLVFAACGGSSENPPVGAANGNPSNPSPQTPARWTVGAELSRYDLLAVDFIDPQNGWVVGDINPDGGLLFRTTDGGASWRPAAKTTEVFAAIEFVSATRGWMAGYAGRIERSDDGGASWRTQRFEQSGEVLNALCFLDGERGWAAGGRGLLLQTTNGGASWETRQTARVEDFWAIRFATPERGFLVGEDGVILATTDGGANWAQQKSATTNALFGLAISASGAVIAVGQGGTILRSTDGVNWSAVASGTTKMINAVAAAPDGETLRAVGARGVTLYSTDDGKSWTIEEGDARRDWLAIALMGMTTGTARGVAVGRRGAIQRLQ